MKYTLLLTILLFCTRGMAQKAVTLKVRSAEDLSLIIGANISDRYNRLIGQTDQKGEVKVSTGQREVRISHIGFNTKEFSIEGVTSDTVTVYLETFSNSLDELVISTGYQVLPRERSTGSFSLISSENLSRISSFDVVSQLEGVGNGLVLNKSGIYGENHTNSPNLRVRGINTLFANSEPLIVVDNFAYHGSINSINPNDIASVTILKDAAAASIWGARAANGVIVITTKNAGKSSKPALSFNFNTRLTHRPDLYSSPEFLNSKDFISFEKLLFEKGGYVRDNVKVFTPVAELLLDVKDGKITMSQAEEAMQKFAHYDIRKEASDLLYKTGVASQYSMSVEGSTGSHSYYLSAGYDKNTAYIRGNDNDRMTLMVKNNISLTSKLSLGVNYNYVLNTSNSNGVSFSNLGTGGLLTIYPYARLVDDEGQPLPLVRDIGDFYKDSQQSTIDWSYYPVRERGNLNNLSKNSDNRLDLSLKQGWFKGLSTDILYQYQNSTTSGESIYDQESYYVRHLVNRFTQSDGTRIIPYGNIYNASSSTRSAHSIRGQVNYNVDLNKSSFDIIAGSEIRQNKNVSDPSVILYSFDYESSQGQNAFDFVTIYNVKPQGRQQIPRGSASKRILLNRYVSYYSNIGYSVLSRYAFTFSSRWDASNLYGVKTNQKGVPLWHAGASWLLSKEKFYKSRYVDYLKLRITYGNAGNTVSNITAYPIYSYGSYDFVSGLPYGTLRNAGNPDLRWEKTAIANVGVDFSAFTSRLSGSAEIFKKNTTDLIGEIAMDPTSGIISKQILPTGVTNRINYASTKTVGVDVQLNGIITDRSVKWQTVLMYNYANNTVVDYETAPNIQVSTFVNNPAPVIGNSIDALYSIPWHGLSSADGSPLVPTADNTMSNSTADYSRYLQNLSYKDLVYHGSAIPVHTGSMRNILSWKGVGISFTTLWKGGYSIRRRGLSYSAFINSKTVHKEFTSRWQTTGDELSTSVPSFIGTLNHNRDLLYQLSSTLVEKGDFIRLQDINLSYDVGNKLKVLKDVRLYMNSNNVGILWRANKQGLDPEYVNAQYPMPMTISIGLSGKF